MNIVSTVRQEEVIIVMCGGGTEVGCWLGLERKLVWAEEEREKIRKRDTIPSQSDSNRCFISTACIFKSCNLKI